MGLARGARSRRDEAVAEALDPPYHSRLAGCAFGGLVGERDEFRGMEAGGKTLQALRGDRPVTVTARAFKEVQMPFEAIEEGGAQLGAQRGIFPRCGGERIVEGTMRVCHSPQTIAVR